MSIKRGDQVIVTRTGHRANGRTLEVKEILIVYGKATGVTTATVYYVLKGTGQEWFNKNEVTKVINELVPEESVNEGSEPTK